MKFSTIVLALAAAATGAVADLHTYAECYSHIQPVGNDNSAAIKAACAAYKKRNTGTKQWDTCTDCEVLKRGTTDPNECGWTCNSHGYHVGRDGWSYYCKQAGADGSYAY